MKTCIIIPARFKSTRFPGKPLVKLLNKPMIIWVCELSAKAVGKSNVYVATEDHSIEKTVKQFGFQTIITSADALTGTDRIAEASKHLEYDIYMNVQGDEPLVHPDDIIKIRDAKITNMDLVINGFNWVLNSENQESVNIPKVITNENNELIYMSRKALPGFKDIKLKPNKYKKQVCIYAFTKEELKIYNDFGRKSELEKSEDIEIIRFFELNKRILMIETNSLSLSVDVPEDVPNVEKALKDNLFLKR